MNTAAVVGFVVLLAGAGAVVATTPQEALPPGHPPLTPPGHPPVTTQPDALPAGHPPLTPDAAAARPEDVNTVASIVAIAVSGADADFVLDGPDEATMLLELDALLAGLGDGVLVTWNGSGFDLPFIARRAHLLELSLGLSIWPDPTISTPHEPRPGQLDRVRGRWYELGHIDGYLAYRSDVHDPTRQGLQHRACPLEVLCRSAHQRHETSLASRTHRSGDGRIHEAGALLFAGGGELSGRLGPQRAHLDE